MLSSDVSDSSITATTRLNCVRQLHDTSQVQSFPRCWKSGTPGYFIKTAHEGIDGRATEAIRDEL